ncbi:TIGR00269 family protein [Candidatus Micrarchaeota archaeon CG1_02_55_22]|nr:MAG: TIGR00269 family protein [Candidatus Micrarchaeota archaeon CG1_02_55_22]
MQCACGRIAQVRLDYNATDLCKECFCKLFEDRVRKANKEFKLLRRGDVIAVGVSGGKDSAAMLFVLKKLADEIGEITLKPILIDEGIAGYRDKSEKKARQLCEKLGLELHVVAYKDLYDKSMDEIIAVRDKTRENDAARGENACTYCGVFRKQALNKASRGMGANKLAIGHNADDVGQTLLINLLRGETSRNEADTEEVPEGFVKRIKPLIYNLERECALYCLLQDLPFHRAECPYSKEAFRGKVKTFLNEAENERPGVKFSILNSALSMPNKTEKKGERVQCAECGEPCNNKVCRTCQLKKELGA